MEIKHFNQTELAKRWCLSPRTLERWRWQGVGPAYLKLGMRVVYPLEDIEKFERQGRYDLQSGNDSRIANAVKIQLTA